MTMPGGPWPLSYWGPRLFVEILLAYLLALIAKRRWEEMKREGPLTLFLIVVAFLSALIAAGFALCVIKYPNFE